jgi:hypothetical protein
MVEWQLDPTAPKRCLSILPRDLKVEGTPLPKLILPAQFGFMNLHNFQQDLVQFLGIAHG